LKIQVNSNSSDALNELEGLNVLDISLQEGAHIISHKEIKGVDLLSATLLKPKI
tara:strand:- start:704 stop:865 length:162 start_codon:yes stop_codon:yes gene_type:complete